LSLTILMRAKSWIRHLGRSIVALRVINHIFSEFFQKI